MLLRVLPLLVAAPLACARTEAPPANAPPPSTAPAPASDGAAVGSCGAPTSMGVDTSGGGLSSASSDAKPSSTTSSAPAAPQDVVVESIEGASTLVDAESVVAKNRWRLKSCLYKARNDDPQVAGTSTVAVEIDADGAVTESVASGTLPSPLLSCVADAFRAHKFGPTKDCKPTKIAVTVRFQAS